MRLTGKTIIVLCLCTLPAWAGDESEEAPQVTPEQRAINRLIDEKRSFDVKTWRLVAKYWNRGEKCVDLFDVHADMGRDRVTSAYAEVESLRCNIDEDGEVSWWLQDETLDTFFQEALAAEIAAIDGMKNPLLEDEIMRDLAERIQERDRGFRREICEQLTAEKEGKPNPPPNDSRR